MATLPTWLTRLWRPAAVRAPAEAPRPRTATRGRQTADSDLLDGFNALFAWVVPPADWEKSWRLYQLDRATLDKIEPGELMKALADLSPELSAAVWYFQRLCNPGWTVEVTGLDGTAENPEGTAVVQAIMARLARRHGATEVVINRLFMAAYLRGALFTEAVFGPDGRTLVDIATPDPISARFRRNQRAGEGWYWQLGQQVQGKFVPLDDFETVVYVPIDPFPDSNYGRPLVAPALFTCLMTIGILHDLRRVISQQGYPRYDVSIMYERAIQSMPAMVQNDPAQFKLWLDGIFNDVADAYAKLEPDDAFIHFDHVAVNRPTGAVDAGSLRSIDALFEMLSRMAARAVKLPPLLMGITDGVSEANANRQWEMLIATIKAIQHPVEQVLGRYLDLALQAAGVQGTVTVRFAEVRAAEMLRDAQVEAQRIKNTWGKYQAGWIDQDEASMEITGHDPAEPEPRGAVDAEVGTTSEQPAPQQGEPGEDEDMADRATDVERKPVRVSSKRGVETPVTPSTSNNGHVNGRRDPWRPAADDTPPPPAVPEPDPTLDGRAGALWDLRMGDAWDGLLDAEPVGEEVERG